MLRYEKAAWALCVLVALAFYTWRLGSVPVGFHQDEASVGWNARQIVRSGTDQYGTPWPLFFRAFDDYKSPVSIYAVAVSEAALGPTPFAVRLPAVFWALGTAVALYFLLCALTDNRALSRWMAVLYLWSPTAIIFGRAVFTEAVTLPLFLVLALLALQRFSQKPDTARAALSGALLAFLVYTYSTMRLLAPLLVLTALACFAFDRRARKHLVTLGAAALLVALPYAWFLTAHPNTLELRFQKVGIFFDHPDALVALGRFARNMSLHLGFDFLFWRGDANPRHSAGNGLLPLWLALPLVGGCVVLARRRAEPFCAFLLAALALAAIPASLTQDEVPHASRMLHMLPLAFVVGTLGIDAWVRTRAPSAALLGGLLLLPLVEGGAFVARYFTTYASTTQASFDEGRTEALRAAWAHRTPGSVVGLPYKAVQFGGIWVAFVGDYDAAVVREHGLQDVAIVGPQGPALPPGSVVLTLGATPPAQPAERLEVIADGIDGSPLWTIWRTR